MGKKIKIILVDAYIGNFPSLGLAYIAAYLREKNGICDIQILQRKFCPNLIDRITDEKADIVGYFSITPGFDKLLEVIAGVRKRDSGVAQIMGGPHMTALPKRLPKEINVGVISEGEITMSELVNIYVKYKRFPLQELERVKGIVYWKGEEIVQNEKREPIKNIDDLPLPARDLLNIEGYYPVNFRGFPTKILNSTGMMTSRGCPFNCAFCQENVLSRFRAHSAKRAVKEIEELINRYKCNFIQIMDDQFLVSVDRLKKIVQLIIEKKFHKKASFFCYLRANQITEKTAPLLKKMNTKIVFIGFESGSDRILKYLKDKTCSVANNQRAYDLCRKYGMEVYGAFIAGSPDETMEDLEKTYQFIKKNHLAIGEIFILTPLPGTRIWDYAVSKGYLNPDAEISWDKLLIKTTSGYKDKLWLSEHISKEEYYNFYEKKIRPVFWHYLQVANGFSFIDLLRPVFWKRVRKRPKFFLSVLKQSIIHFFKCKISLYNEKVQ
ncbi:radical SAM protein [Candidatus Parcubacteria bacterium]|nr:MAG: radical SAM protein [Candidatus Parcubacteria bacterium]